MTSSPQTSSPPIPEKPSGGQCPVTAKVAAYLDNELPTEEAEAVTQHLEGCLPCQAAAEAACQMIAVTSKDLLWFPEAADETPGVSPPAVPETDPGIATESVGPSFPVQSMRLLADRFELRRTVGMGGCGAVYEAWDRQLRRVVAVKVPHWTLYEKPSVRQRFAKEAHAAARLSHQNVVPVHEACIGESGDCYLVSEYVPGPSLEEWITRQSGLSRRIEIRKAAMIVAEIAAGVDAAHAAGVIHRDLKPSNVLLAPMKNGELPFVPRVTDFGIARLSEEATATTTEGRVFGSWPYMSPEQASAAKDVGPSSDVYSLGVVLYELLTGEVPITAETVPALLSAIPVQVVVPPRRKRPEIPADLEAVCLKCLEKRSKDRYRTAGELAVDLRRFLAGEAVTARLPGRWERLPRWVRRNPTTASVLATLAVAVVVVVGVLVDANQKQSEYIQQLETADRERTSASSQLRTSNAQLTRAVIDAGQARRQTEAQRQKLQENLYVSEFQQALQAWEKQDLPVMERTLDRLDQPEFAPFRGIEYDWLRTKLYRPRRELMTFPRAVYTLAFSGDGEILAAAGRDAIVKLVRFADGSPVGEWETGQKEVNGLAFVDGNQKLWTSGDDGSLVLWEIATRKKLRRLNAHAPEQAHDLMVIPHLNLLLSMGTDGRVLLWDPLTGESVGELPGNGQRAVATEMHLDGQHLYVAYQNQIGRWMLADRTQVSAFPLRYRPMSFRLSADGHWMFVTNESKNLEVRDSQTGEVVAETHLNDQVRQVIRIPRSASYFAVDDRGTLHEWTPVVGETERSMGIKSRIVASLLDGRTYFAQFTPDFLGIVAATSDGSVGTWPAAAIDSPFLGDLFLGPVEELQYVPDDRGVMFLQGNALQALDLETREQYTFCQVEDRYCHELCVMPVDLLTGETDASGQDWLVHRRGGSGEILAEASISPGGGIGDLQFDATSGVITLHKPLENGPALRMFSLVPLNEVKPWRLRNVPKFSTYSPSTDCLIVVSQNSLVAHDILKRDVVWRKDVPGDVVAIAMSLDGRFVASATEDRIIRIWDARDGSLVAEMIGHHGQITSVVFANDGRTLFSGDHRVKEPSEVRCWRVATGHFLGVVHSAENASIDQLLISRSNDRLLIRYGRQRLKIVPLKPSAVR